MDIAHLTNEEHMALSKLYRHLSMAVESRAMARTPQHRVSCDATIDMLEDQINDLTTTWRK